MDRTKLDNRVGVTTATAGTGTLTLGSVIDVTYITFAQAGAVTGDVVSYVITNGNDFELGRGTYDSTTPTLTRDTVLISKISGVVGTTKLTLSGSSEVRCTMLREDLLYLISYTDAANHAICGGL